MDGPHRRRPEDIPMICDALGSGLRSALSALAAPGGGASPSSPATWTLCGSSSPASTGSTSTPGSGESRRRPLLHRRARGALAAAGRRELRCGGLAWNDCAPPAVAPPPHRTPVCVHVCVRWVGEGDLYRMWTVGVVHGWPAFGVNWANLGQPLANIDQVRSWLARTSPNIAPHRPELAKHRPNRSSRSKFTATRRCSKQVATHKPRSQDA